MNELFNVKGKVVVITGGAGILGKGIAAYLAKGYPLDDAVISAKEYLSRAIESGADYAIGKGHGPVNHFHALWK